MLGLSTAKTRSAMHSVTQSDSRRMATEKARQLAMSELEMPRATWSALRSMETTWELQWAAKMSGSALALPWELTSSVIQMEEPWAQT